MRSACARLLAILAAVALLCDGVGAISVIAPTFQELVAEAQTVFVGEVTATQALWIGDGAQRTIVTNVTFAVETTLKGADERVRVLRFIGGAVGDQTLTVPGIPTFKVGDRAVLFVTNDVNAISPLVGVMHGRFPLTKASDGREYVALHDGRVFSSVGQVGPSAVTASPTPLRPMRREDFENEVRLELQRRGGSR
jgi:hypothetical protein